MVNANTTDQICTICGKEHELGIHIVSSFICSDCEQELVATDVKDERYPFFVARMKHIFFERNINA